MRWRPWPAGFGIVAADRGPIDSRDPDGIYAERLGSLGALDDGKVDIVDESDLLASFMTDLGYDTQRTMLPDSGHEWRSVSAADRQALVGAILASD